MAAKKPKIVQVGPQGALLWDQPEPVQVVAPSLFQRPSPARLAALRRKWGGERLWHKSIAPPHSTGRFVASLGRKEEETKLDSPRG